MSMTACEARALLDGGFTCAIYSESEILKSTERGVAPLLDWLQSGRNFSGFSAVDKVVGKAAAYLYVLLDVERVHALVISEGAAEVFARFGIAYTYEEKVSAIRNRTNTGFCPMEQAVWAINEPQVAYKVIQQSLEKLKKNG